MIEVWSGCFVMVSRVIYMTLAPYPEGGKDDTGCPHFRLCIAMEGDETVRRAGTKKELTVLAKGISDKINSMLIGRV